MDVCILAILTESSINRVGCLVGREQMNVNNGQCKSIAGGPKGLGETDGWEREGDMGVLVLLT